MTARTGATALHDAAPVAEPLYAIRLDGTLRLAMTCHEAADLTGMTIREVWGAINRGELEATCGGRQYRITVQALLGYLGLLPSSERKTA